MWRGKKGEFERGNACIWWRVHGQRLRLVDSYQNIRLHTGHITGMHAVVVLLTYLCPEGSQMTWLEVVLNYMEGLDLASLDALDHHAWRRKIVGERCWPRFACYLPLDSSQDDRMGYVNRSADHEKPKKLYLLEEAWRSLGLPGVALSSRLLENAQVNSTVKNYFQTEERIHMRLRN